MQSSNFNLIQLGVVLLTAATAIIHLVLGIPNGLILFVLNGIGYLALVAALYLPHWLSITALTRYTPWMRWALIAFTAVTILGWVAVGERNAIGFIDKIIEVLLIILLVIEMRQK